MRSRLARQISNANLNEQGLIPLVTLSPDWEQSFAEAIVGQGDERQLSMAPMRGDIAEIFSSGIEVTGFEGALVFQSGSPFPVSPLRDAQHREGGEMVA